MIEFLRILMPTPLGWVFVLPAWGLAIAALVMLGRQWRGLGEEEAALAGLRKLLGARDTGGGRVSLEQWLGSLAPESLLARLTETLWAQREMKAPDLEAIHGMVAEAGASRQTFPRAVPNLAMLFGLLGTVAGLAEVVRALGPQLQAAAGSGDPQLMARAIGGQLAHLQTAFGCTLHGLFWAAAVGFAIGLVESRQNRLLDAIHAVGLNDLAPRIFPHSLEYHLEALQKKLDDGVDLMRAAGEQMAQASDRLREHVDLLEGATTKTGETLERVTESMAASAGVLQTSVQALKELQVEVHGVYVALMERHDAGQEEFRRRAETLIAKIDALQGGFTANARQVVEQLQLAAHHTAESTAQFREAGARFERMSGEIGQRAYDAMAERADAFRDAMLAHRQAVALLEGQVRDLMERLDPRLLPRDEWERLIAALDAVARAVSTNDQPTNDGAAPADSRDPLSVSGVPKARLAASGTAEG